MKKSKRLIVKSLIVILAVGYVAFNFTELKESFMSGFNSAMQSK